MKSGEFTASLTQYQRRPTVVVHVGHTPMGGEFPVRIQSMANTLTCDITGSVAQCIRLQDAGAEYIRFTVPSPADVRCLKQIRRELSEKGSTVPLIADVHFNPAIALEAVDAVEKVRINPGNYGRRLLRSGKDENRPMESGERFETDEMGEVRTKFVQLLQACREKKIALRIGVNHGSLSPRIMEKYGDSPEGMAESAMELFRICKEEHFDQVVVSMKSSNVRVMVYATRLIVHKMNEEDMHYPVHLGVTEAGEGADGRIRSAAGIAALLADGIGDTIRVSLTEDPVAEVPVARKLVDHIQTLKNHESLPQLKEFFAGSFAYGRRISHASGFVGGGHVPVVITEADMWRRIEKDEWSSLGWHFDPQKSSWHFDNLSADFIFAPSIEGTIDLPDTKGLILPFVQWERSKNKNTYPLLEVKDYVLKNHNLTDILHFISGDKNDMTDSFFERIREDRSAVLIYGCSNLNVYAELRLVFSRLHDKDCHIPVVIKKAYFENDPESFQIKSAADLGGTFVDGLGDGLWLSNTGKEVVSTAFMILQACRLRISQTEYISCPSCGRTTFDLMSTVTKIRERTGHLKGLKIAVMGCIVNGPGEMADADYGYVGSGKGRITLYKSKEIIRRSIPEDRAVEDLINLIRESGDWKDPQ